MNGASFGHLPHDGSLATRSRDDTRTPVLATRREDLLIVLAIRTTAPRLRLIVEIPLCGKKIRIENELKDADEKWVKLKECAEVEVTIEAARDAVEKKTAYV
jgi:hypothetical protein